MENITLINTNEPLKINKPIRLIELFAGIGSQAKALQRLNANFEHYKICEFDKYAIKSYNAIHGTNFETSDIRNITAEDLAIVDTDKYCYIMTYSFPCQDLSLAGKGKGMAKGANTRSGLLWEVERLLNECTELPQILLMENVPQVHGKKNKEHFEEWISFLESKGYSNYWKDLNAKNFGIPQNRNRCYMVSVLGGVTYNFPKEIPLNITLKDVLDTEVEEKYYLSDSKLKMIANWKSFEKPLKKVNGRDSIAQTLTTRTSADCSSIITYSDKLSGTTDVEPMVFTNNLNEIPLQKKVCNKAIENNLVEPYDIFDPTYANSRLKEIEENNIALKNSRNNQIAHTLTTNVGNFAVCVPEEPVAYTDPFICASRGRNPENPSDRTAGIHLEQRLEPNFSGCSNTLTTVQKDNYVCEPTIKVIGNYSPSNHDASRIVSTDSLAPTVKENHGTVTATVEPSSLRIRKLTPKECWRLMGFDDTDFNRAEKVNSSSQLYKQAGNSIVVNVLYHIFKEML